MKSIIRNIYRYLLLLVCILTASVSAWGRDFVVVIDPGHGGKDVGAVGKKAREKDINLGVALKLGDLIRENFDDVKIVYTRDDDTFISLQGRADVANKAHGDLFISIHTNSVDRRSKNRLTVHGAATYTLGLHRSEENLEVAKRENSVIVLEDDYTARYCGFDPNSTESYIVFELSQNKHMEQSVQFASMVQSCFSKVGRKDNGVRQAGFWVLAATGMPAVLVELDFICNPTQEKYLSSDSGQKELAGSIYDAFVQYKEANDFYSKSMSVKTVEKKSKKSATVKEDKVKAKDKEKAEKKNDDTIIYKVQFLTSAKKLSKNSSHFKGLKDCDYYYENGLYKYTYGEIDSKSKAQKELRKVREKFKEAFIVEFKNDKRVK